jgi:SMC interacting uncharacterized protein involved in chromosome segregation
MPNYKGDSFFEREAMDMVVELAELFRDKPELVDQKILALGKKCLTLYEDPAQLESYSNAVSMKYEVYEMMIQDVAVGAPTLMKSKIGILKAKDGELRTFITPIKTAPPGVILFSGNLVLKNEMTHEGSKISDLTQAELEAVLFYLASKFSEFC